jgi:hypothetical protein
MSTQATHTKHWFFSDAELRQDAGRKWPAHLSFEQMRDQLRHEIANGFAPPINQPA